MAIRAGTRNDEENMKQEKQKWKESLRKEIINKKIFQSRQVLSPTAVQIVHQEQPEHEEQEAQKKEETGKKKEYLPVNQHAKKHAWKSKKKCWYCHSPYHLKKDCKNMQCFYCLRLGHIKANCYKRKIDLIFEWLVQMAKNIKEIQKRRFKTQKNVLDKIKESSFVQKEGSHYLFWKDQEVGIYTGPGIPTPTKKLLKHPEDYKLTEVVVRKGIPIEKLKLLKGFTNWCMCGRTGLTGEQFKRHIFLEHKGIAPPSSVLNRPFYVDWVDFFSDEAEILYSNISPDCL